LVHTERQLQIHPHKFKGPEHRSVGAPSPSVCRTFGTVCHHYTNWVTLIISQTS